MANRNSIKSKAPDISNKHVKQKVSVEAPVKKVKTTIKIASGRNTKIKIKKS